MKPEFVERVEEYGIDRLLDDLNAKKIVKTDDDTFRSTCPVHNGENGSSLFYKNGFFTCFADCGRRYNILELIQESLHCTKIEAIRFIEERIGGISFGFRNPIDSNNIENREFIRQVKKKTKKNTEEEYVDISDESIFLKALHKTLVEQGYTNKTREHFDLRYCTTGAMNKRIIIPIKDKYSRIVGLAGRSTNTEKEIDMLKLGKYKFTKGLKKSQYLYNYDYIIKNKPKYVIVVEGYKSVWRLHEWGYENSVAIMGSNISETQLKLLIKLDCPILVSGDNDPAGKMMERDIARKLKSYSDVRIFPIANTKAKETDSIADISKEDFERNLKGVMNG